MRQISLNVSIISCGNRTFRILSKWNKVVENSEQFYLSPSVNCGLHCDDFHENHKGIAWTSITPNATHIAQEI